ncbi:9920_t:CDS:2 [Cetraspora pellucida]|uniref:9920_t:CDS:1 n=1 Tax=Cetraspora pellucida TaxID=1433469 RepID=A0A9N9BLR7_9GLOM|nr:9920_t:CDS:2 [Cetraspora pellucida]
MYKEGILVEKCRKTKVWPENLCLAKIKVTRFVTELKVQPIRKTLPFWLADSYEFHPQNQQAQLAFIYTTIISCEEVLKQAISKCSVPVIKKYIKHNYTKNICYWALKAHQHLPFLLQMTSTNFLESYHSKLKQISSPHHGLIGICNRIVIIDTKKQSDSEYVGFEFHTKKISVIGINYKILDEIHKLSYPVQKLIVNEIFAIEKRLKKDSRFEINEYQELVEIKKPKRTKAKKVTENRCIIVDELIE